MDDHVALDRQVRLAVYRGFIDTGHPPTAFEIADSVGAGPGEIEDSLQRLERDHMIVLAPGTPYVWMANPFSAVPTPFRVESERGAWWGNCIWDSIGIPAMLRVDATIKTWCPDCGERLVLRTRGEEISGDESTVHIAVPAAKWWDDIGFT